MKKKLNRVRQGGGCRLFLPFFRWPRDQVPFGDMSCFEYLHGPGPVKGGNSERWKVGYALRSGTVIRVMIYVAHRHRRGDRNAHLSVANSHHLHLRR